VTTALYRRYRPETFAEVIGQEHVTAPLMQALRSGRVNHAYLFSGPRGCGKTTSARILARTLNCARNAPENPIDTPCGECDSCVELARGGPGSLDVVEIDAASHNGVDDARDLRERATFAPARDRYKIFILDEAHMVTPQGFNALLKIVEEPPPHVKFVFATTEPDKVIGTIRSRTHHYPFRLVPPDVLGPYLEELCVAEGIALGSGVIPLVTRAGGGSVRDSLSVLDQLIAGATGGTLEYDVAVGLLGFTHATLLDDVVDALAARDGASLFRVVDQVVASGHEPRRFVEDVLERLRDLIVLAVSGDAAEAALRGLPADQLERMQAQASHLGASELSRAADLVNAALTEMTGATSPRLHLELLCARLLLPGADDGTAGLAARIDRLERGGITGGLGTVAPPASEPAATSPSGASSASGAAAARAALQASRRPQPRADEAAGSEPTEPAPLPVAEPAPAPVAEPAPVPAPQPVVDPAPVDPAPVDPEPEADPAPDVDLTPPEVDSPADIEPEPAEPPSPPAPDRPQASAQGSQDAGDITAELVRRRWDEVVANIGSPVTRALVGPNAQVGSFENGVLRLSFSAPGMARTFAQPRHIGAVEESVYQTLGVRVRVEAGLDEGRGPGPGSGPAPGGPGPGGPAGPGGPGGPAGPGGDAPEPDARAASGPAAAPAGRQSSSDEGWPAVAAPGATARAVGARGNAGAATRAPEARGAVAVVERPAVEAPEPPAPDDGPAPSTQAEDADAAWLAGVPAFEPPPDPEGAPEPPPEPSFEAAGSPRRPDAPRIRETPRQSAERQAREHSRGAAQSVGAPDDGDEPSADDPDIASTGLVGVPLVVQVLGGKVIDEVVDGQ